MTTITELAQLLAGAPERVAPRLLGHLLVSTVKDERVVMRISEVEAYKGEDDPASHAFRGRTDRNGSMFERPGTLYCYRSYGIHTCANTAVGPVDAGWGVLIRGGELIEGETVARRRRRRSDQLTNGPGKVCQALSITIDHNGLHLLDPKSPIRLEPGIPPKLVMSTPRIGISKAKERPWRFVPVHQVSN